MKIRMEDGLPLVKVSLEYKGNKINLENVLFDSGCANTIFDTDLLDEIGLDIDLIQGKVRRMYGVGGQGELCYKQMVNNFGIDSRNFPCFCMQFGLTRESYGFDGILGIDFMIQTGLIADFNKMETMYS